LEGSNTTITLTKVISEKGAAGIIYRHPLRADLCIKVYRKPEDASRHEAKVRAMLASPPSDIYADMSGTRIAQLAWPIEVVRCNGKFAGFVMPLIGATIDMEKLIQPIRRAIPPALPEHLLFRLRACLNLAILLRNIHLKGHRMIDVKPDNVTVYAWNPAAPQRGAGCVALLDCDGEAPPSGPAPKGRVNAL
jgi:DNA-binding helix-hairpin-helix protein with protein kinase domain